MLARLRSLVRSAAGRGRFETRLAEELRFHLEARIDHLVSEGCPPEEARRRARLEFGAPERVREQCREAVGLRWLDAAARNARFALRLLRRDPVFTCAVLLTIGLCIGANTAVLSLVDAVLFRPLPYPDPSRLMQVAVAFERGGARGDQSEQTGRVWEAVRDHAPALQPAVYSDWVTEVNLATSGQVDRVRQQRVSAGFFAVLGVPPLVGREFTADEDRAGGPPVVVLSQRLWQRLFGGGASAVGSRVFLRGEPHTVVGVMPDRFQSSGRADVWTPLRPTTTGEGGGSNYQVIARLKPGQSAPAADAQLGAISREVLREVDLPADARAWLHVVPMQQGWAEDARTPLLLLWAAVGLVLIIGCSNVASLLLARGVRRTRELATRMALGGGRGAVVAQLLTEGLLLAVLGGAVGVAIGWGLLATLGPAVAERLGIWQRIAVDLRVLGASAALAVATSLVFGLFPALRSARVDVCAALVEGGGRSVAGTRHPWPRRLLVVVEVALGLALAVAAGLLVRTFVELNDQTSGFDPRGVLAAEVSLADARYRTRAEVTRLFRDSLDRIGRLPGVGSAGVILTLPYERALNLGFRMSGGRSDGEVTNVCYVTPGVFGALRMALLRGRWLAEADGAQAAPVVLVSESFARRYFPRAEAVGAHIQMADAARGDRRVGARRAPPGRLGGLRPTRPDADRLRPGRPAARCAVPTGAHVVLAAVGGSDQSPLVRAHQWNAGGTLEYRPTARDEWVPERRRGPRDVPGRATAEGPAAERPGWAGDGPQLRGHLRPDQPERRRATSRAGNPARARGARRPGSWCSGHAGTRSGGSGRRCRRCGGRGLPAVAARAGVGRAAARPGNLRGGRCGAARDGRGGQPDTGPSRGTARPCTHASG